MAVHCVVPPHPAALFVTNNGADVGTVVVYGLVALMASLVGGPLFLKLLGNRLPFKPVPAEFSDLKVREEHTLPSLGATLFTVLLPIALMLVKTIAELNGKRQRRIRCCLSATRSPRCLSPCLSPTTCWGSPAYGNGRADIPSTVLLYRQHFADYRRGRAFNAILKPADWRIAGAYSLEPAHAPILLAWLVALVLHAAVAPPRSR
jgi:D-serine transporter